MSPTKTTKKAAKRPAAKAAKAKKPAKKAAAKKAPAKKAPAKKAESKPAAPKHGAICHVEFVAQDIDAAGKLYGELFGWQVFPFQPGMHYFQSQDNMGGCINQGTPASDGKTVLYVQADDIEKTIAHAERLGASVVQGKTEIAGGHGFCAVVRMPEGNTVGLYNRH